ncbi:MAG: lysophospholipid acyltransferase family protein [Bacteroidia bacterium]|jgi:KDO2-lipid IV(A) lauroyltransferase
MIVLNLILYYLVIIPLSLLPMPILYLISDGVYVLVYHGFGYRKKVVLQNIRNSFPEKTTEEHIKISKQFYRYFCDVILETLKTFTISERELAKRVVCHDPGVIDKYFDRGQSVIIAAGHYNNTQMFAVGIDRLLKHKVGGIYQPLTNKFFEEKMRKVRGKYGLTMVPTKKVKEFFDDNTNELIAPAFAIDQSPSNPNKAYWTTFLNQDSGVLFGTEKYAKDYNFPVVYCRMNLVKRGHYSLDFMDVVEKPRETAYGEITEKVTRLLEKDIRAVPQYWLWTHRRWKHKKPAVVNEQL